MTNDNGTKPNPTLQSLIYKKVGDSGDGDKNNKKHTLQVLDQLLLPHETQYIEIRNVTEAYNVIKNMQIRGAPLIAIVACLALAVDFTSYGPTLDELQKLASTEGTVAVLAYILEKMNHLESSRPTAVNLQNAMAELKTRLQIRVDEEDATVNGTTLVDIVVDYAQFMYDRDAADNQQIGNHGAKAILANVPAADMDQNVTLMTICNTGSLATSHYGTALGIVRSVRAANRLQQIVALETRPYNQGSRLTAYEMVVEQMPQATLICDNMAAAFMQQHAVHACVVGADRVCANGDTANKIGTYMLALVAHAHNVPFYVAAPLTTLDVNLANGSQIPIEQRPATELLQTSQAPANINVWNPAFDVTPAHLITGIVTEKGVISPQAKGGTFDCAAFCAQFAK